MRNIALLFLMYYYSGDQIEKNKTGWAHGTYGRWEMCLQGFAVISGKEITKKNQAQLGDYNKMNLQEMGWKGMDWIDLAQDRYR